MAETNTNHVPTNQDDPFKATIEEVWAILRETVEQQKEWQKEWRREWEERQEKRQAEAEEEAKKRQAEAEEEAKKRQVEAEKRQAEAERRQAEAEEETKRRQAEAEKRQAEAERRQAEAEKEAERRQKEWEKTERIVRRTNKQLGDLHRRFGQLAEHLVAPNIHKRFNELGYHFGSHAPGGIKIFDEQGKTKTEIDFLLENGETIMALEVKTKPAIKDVEHHIRRLEILRDHRRGLNDRRTIQGAIAGAIFGPEEKKAVVEAGLYVVEQSGDTMKIDVPDGFVPREW